MTKPPTTAGYTGVTASGAGFTGLVPVAVPAADYDTAVAETALPDIPVTAYEGVTQQQAVPTEKTSEPPAEEELSAYAYEWDIGLVSELVTPESAMTVMKDAPNVVFPFEVQGQNGERTIRAGSDYHLNNVRIPGDSGNPVRVVQSDGTSFTFLTLPGHFCGPGRTIRFSTLDRDGRLLLRQEGVSAASLVDEIYDSGARIAWRFQADNLRAALFGGERADFPGAFPVSW
ncbi:hypothetical protein [Streptomyces tailanensis]|uniref:hypothetical protein n=1 Tax=Streptomyces tailanensis TaxID=2569858 RepID=UPI00122E9209|nr:hypothetical protein [Streptomyces tailanensis]